MVKPTLYLMMGLPGAGKTTVSELLALQTGASHINSDRLRKKIFGAPRFTKSEHEKLYKTLDHMTELLLKSGKSAIYDANLNRYKHRKEKYDLCKKLGAQPQLIWVKTDEQTAKKRATKLADHHPDLRPFGNMSDEMFDRISRQIELPKSGEKYTELVGKNVTLATIQQLFS